MIDKIEKIGKNSVIQHGKHSDRIYLMKLGEEDVPEIIGQLNSLARQEKYTKIFCKVPMWAVPLFAANGFITEAQIPGFYNNNLSVFFMSKFINSDRIMNFETDQLGKFSSLLYSQISDHEHGNNVNSKFSVIQLGESDIEEAADVYKKVFKSYPFPIHDPEYISKTMKTNIQYFGIRKNGNLVALSSAEKDMKGGNAEMTDFATLPVARGNNLSSLLLVEMEKAMTEIGIKTVYTIARLNSIAMNKTFLKQDYVYSGTLIKNTNIAGKIESMNVLYKHI